VIRHLPSTANEGLKSSLHMITGNKVFLSHILPFGSLLFIARDKKQIHDPKFDPRAQAAIYLGHGSSEGRKCIKGYTFNFSNTGYKGHILYSNSVYSDPTYFPFRKRGEERVLSLSGASYMSGKEKLDQEIPIPPEVEEWVNVVEVQYNVETSEDQQEFENESAVSDKDLDTEKGTPIDNQIMGYNEAQDQYAVKSGGEIKYVDSSELFQTVSNGERVFVEGITGSIPGFSIFFQDQEDVFIKKMAKCMWNMLLLRSLRRNFMICTVYENSG
jgi:hypothetical protein